MRSIACEASDSALASSSAAEESGELGTGTAIRARDATPRMTYSYSFSPELEQEWEWTERYAPQPEILAYAEHVAERFDLLQDIQFDTTVTSVTYDDDRRSWIVATDRGDRAMPSSASPRQAA